MKTLIAPTLWQTFGSILQQRRAIRDFDGEPIPDQDVRDILLAAMQAPSSTNLQPYQFHWIKDPTLKASVAEDCNGQRGARTASTIIVVAANPKFALRTADRLSDYLDKTDLVSEASKTFQRRLLSKFRRVLTAGSWGVWTLFAGLAGLFRPTLSLLPIGHLGGRGWAARNSFLAVQTLLLAAAAKGIDSGPMEGFSATKIARTLGLERGTVIPVVINLGYRTADARIDPPWRRPPEDVIVEH